MALNGALVTFGEAIDIGTSTIIRPIWSEVVASGGMTNQSAVTRQGSTNRYIFRIKANASGEMYAVRGANPDASKAVSTSEQSARSHLNASQAIDLPALEGDRVSVVNA